MKLRAQFGIQYSAYKKKYKRDPIIDQIVHNSDKDVQNLILNIQTIEQQFGWADARQFVYRQMNLKIVLFDFWIYWNWRSNRNIFPNRIETNQKRKIKNKIITKQTYELLSKQTLVCLFHLCLMSCWVLLFVCPMLMILFPCFAHCWALHIPYYVRCVVCHSFFSGSLCFLYYYLSFTLSIEHWTHIHARSVDKHFEFYWISIKI